MKLVDLGGINPSGDTAPFQKLFVETVEGPFSVTQKWFISQLNDSSQPVEAAPASTADQTNSMKKEAVRLPAS